MYGLPCRDLATSIRGFMMKNGPRKLRSGWNKKIIKHPPPMSGEYHICFMKFSVEYMVWPREVNLASGGQPKAGFFFKPTRKPFLGNNLYFKFH
jgi:hypothetical protein